jgi:hypothetical protein
LKSLINLKELYLTGNNLSKRQIDVLKAALPNCTIYN